VAKTAAATIISLWSKAGDEISVVRQIAETQRGKAPNRLMVKFDYEL